MYGSVSGACGGIGCSVKLPIVAAVMSKYGFCLAGVNCDDVAIMIVCLSDVGCTFGFWSCSCGEGSNLAIPGVLGVLISSWVRELVMERPYCE